MTQIPKIRNERRDTIIDPTRIKRIVKKFYE